MQKSILKDFQKNFHSLIGEKIVLYGTGQYTELIVNNAHDFYIVGLMDANRTGEVIYNLPVLSPDEIVKQQVKTIIIISNLSVAPDIYERIHEFTNEQSIVVYYMNGRRAGWVDTEVSMHTYWNTDKDALLNNIAKNDVISFDLFDTLIMRKCLRPTEVFWILERRAGEKGIIISDFVKQRQLAEKFLYHNVNLFYNLHNIYQYLKNKLGLTADEADVLEQMEFQIEKEMIVPRKEVCEIFAQAKHFGKEVVICTDMYLNEKQIMEILDSCNLCPDKLYISCERKASKHIGSLYEEILWEYSNKKILHVGDNLHADIENAMKYGINVFYVASAAKMMELTKCSAWEEQMNTSTERYTYEIWAQKAFNNPFCGAHTEGKIVLSDMEQYGYLFFGPLVLGYISWLLRMIKEQRLDCILFVARDGYVFYKIYEEIRRKSRYTELPPAIYFYTSRRAASVASIKNEQDIEFIIREVCCTAGISFKELLQKTFGVLCDKDDKYQNMRVGDIGKDVILNHIQEKYKERILQQSSSEREMYDRYLENMKIDRYKRLGMMNFVGRGVTQRCLSKIIDGASLVGMYFALEYDAEEILQDEDEAYAWYSQKMSTHTATDNLFINYLYGEAVFSAPHGSVLKFNENGQPLFEQNEGVKYDKLLEAHQGIETYVKDMLNVFKLDEIALSSNFVDKIQGMLNREKIVWNNWFF